MAKPDTARPATAIAVNGSRGSEQLASRLNPSDTPKPDQLQAPPDNTGEDDQSFFTRRPEARHRFRLPFPGEFSAAILSEARVQARGREVLVMVVIDRDTWTRARGLLVCLPGGTA
jgi:hypothetical protein